MTHQSSINSPMWIKIPKIKSYSPLWDQEEYCGESEPWKNERLQQKEFGNQTQRMWKAMLGFGVIQ